MPDAIYCNRCGEPLCGRRAAYLDPEMVSDYHRTVALVLCFCLGFLGMHRFYVGKVVTGVIWLATGGLFGIGYTVDLILIAMGRFRDSSGLRLVRWEEPSRGSGYIPT